MSDTHPHGPLIRSLAADLRSVRPLAPPWQRALLWSGAVVVLACLVVGLAHPWQTRGAAPHLVALVTTSLAPALTAFAAAWAAFETGVPGSSRGWALLPLPPLVLWIGASGVGCLLAWLAPGGVAPGGPPPGECLTFILVVSLPLSGMLLFMLSRALSLQPGLTAGLAGLAAAAASATILGLFHPADTALLDLVVHAGAVLAVIAASRFAGRRFLARGPQR